MSEETRLPFDRTWFNDYQWMYGERRDLDDSHMDAHEWACRHADRRAVAREGGAEKITAFSVDFRDSAR